MPINKNFWKTYKKTFLYYSNKIIVFFTGEINFTSWGHFNESNYDNLKKRHNDTELNPLNQWRKQRWSFGGWNQLFWRSMFLNWGKWLEPHFILHLNPLLKMAGSAPANHIVIYIRLIIILLYCPKVCWCSRIYMAFCQYNFFFGYE